MALSSNLWVTPPSMINNLMKFVEVSDNDFVSDMPSTALTVNNTGRWFESLCKFHEDRALEMTDLPEGISKTKEALEKFLSLEIKDFNIPTKANTVHVVPLHPEFLDPMLEKWRPDNNGRTKYRFSSSETFLCIGSLPIDMDQESFVQLVSKFGTVTRAFLVFNHHTDQPKGLGLVEYCSREVACQARNLLQGNNGLFCDWLDHRQVTYSCLYSKCLLAPEAGLRGSDPKEVFSCVAIPRYCQVVVGCGVVLAEFATAEQASSTCQSLRDSEIEVHLANPGKNALKLYEKFRSDLLDFRKSERNCKLPVLPLGQPQNLLDDPLKLLGNLFPALPESEPIPAPVLFGSVPMPSLNNAFHFPLACSPLRQPKQIPSTQSIPALHTAFCFGLPCSPVLKILEPLKNFSETECSRTQSIKVPELHSSACSSENLPVDVSPEVSLEGFSLDTPPAWKDFSLRSFSLTPDSVSDVTRSRIKGIREAARSSSHLQPCKRLLVSDDECPQPNKTQRHHERPLAELGNLQAWMVPRDQIQKATWAKWDVSRLESVP